MEYPGITHNPRFKDLHEDVPVFDSTAEVDEPGHLKYVDNTLIGAMCSDPL